MNAERTSFFLSAAALACLLPLAMFADVSPTASRAYVDKQVGAVSNLVLDATKYLTSTGGAMSGTYRFPTDNNSAIVDLGYMTVRSEVVFDTAIPGDDAWYLGNYGDGCLWLSSSRSSMYAFTTNDNCMLLMEDAWGRQCGYTSDGIYVATNRLLSDGYEKYLFSTNSPYGIVRRGETVKIEPKRIAMFVVPVNNETSSGEFTGFELKASTNNFSSTSPDSVRLQFYAQSYCADEGFGDEVDKMKLYVCTSTMSGDKRSYKRITNTIDYEYDSSLQQSRTLSSVVVLVDASCLTRKRNGDWLRDDNEDLMWVYMRSMSNDPPYEAEPGTPSPLWRPIAPVRWFKSLPNWAN